MKRTQVDPGLLVVLIICLLVAWPFISRPGIPQETDAELHIFRTVELHQLQQQGILYARWAPDFYFGYGYPLFNYYAPLVYYLASGFMFLSGAGAVLAVKVIFILGLFLAGSGLYAFVQRYWGKLPAIAAAAVYVCSPYIQYIDPYARGVLAESFSFGLFPWVLWAFGRLDRGNTWRRLPIASAMLAALVCTHNLMALVFTAILIAWILWQSIPHQAKPDLKLFKLFSKPATIRLAAIFLGIVLASFFWLPVFLEKDLVQLGNLVSDGGHFDFHNHFLALSELFGRTLWLDWGATEPQYSFNLGIFQWMLGLIGLGSLIARRKMSKSWWNGLFFGLASVLLIFLILPISKFVWEIVPFMPFLQFPWRLLGPAACCLGILAAISVTEIERILTDQRWGKRSDWFTASLVGLVLFSALPLTYPAEWPADFGSTDLWALNQKERTGRWLGTTSTGDYVPKYVKVVPEYSDQVRDSYHRGGMIDRVNHATLPEGTNVEQTEDHGLTWIYRIDGQKDFVFRVYHFYFPGWVALLDGKEIPINPARPDGFMTMEVPAGSHELELSFHDTTVRKLAWALSGLALLICGVLAFIPLRKKVDDEEVKPQVRFKSVIPFVVVPLFILVLKIGVADPLGWFHYESSGLVASIAQNKTNYRVGDTVSLIGYDLEGGKRGGTLKLTLYWKATGDIDDRYQVFVHLRDSAGAVVSQSDKLNPGNYPTTRWPVDKYVRDQHILTIPADLPAGKYRLAAGLWHMSNSERLPVWDENGVMIGDSIFLETLTY